LTVVEQHPDPSDGHRCSGFLEDGPQQELVRLQYEASGPALQVVDGASGSEAVPADEYCFGAVAASSDIEEKMNALSPLASATKPSSDIDIFRMSLLTGDAPFCSDATSSA
jgi:hypothetical protein